MREERSRVITVIAMDKVQKQSKGQPKEIASLRSQ